MVRRISLASVPPPQGEIPNPNDMVLLSAADVSRLFLPRFLKLLHGHMFSASAGLSSTAAISQTPAEAKPILRSKSTTLCRFCTFSTRSR